MLFSQRRKVVDSYETWLAQLRTTSALPISDEHETFLIYLERHGYLKQPTSALAAEATAYLRAEYEQNKILDCEGGQMVLTYEAYLEREVILVRRKFEEEMMVDYKDDTDRGSERQ